MTEENLIIGEGANAGLPISAPIIHDCEIHYEGDIRWYERDSSFILRQYRDGIWNDVGVVPKAKET